MEEAKAAATATMTAPAAVMEAAAAMVTATAAVASEKAAAMEAAEMAATTYEKIVVHVHNLFLYLRPSPLWPASPR